MSHHTELPKVVDKSQADIDAAILAIQATDLPDHIKDFCISCIRLAVWLPSALLQHKITLANLRSLIFGSESRNKKNNKPAKNKPEKADKEPGDDIGLTETETPITPNKKPVPGHGRLPHSAYINATEHQLSLDEMKAGDQCPMQCGGKLYRFKPGIIVRVTGQNLAAVHKYQVEKLRCASCSYLVSANLPSYIGQEKYDASFKAILALQKYYVAVPFYRQA